MLHWEQSDCSDRNFHVENYVGVEKGEIYGHNRPWRPIGVFPVRYERNLLIKKSKAVPVRGIGGDGGT
jgi:hypothetical protein